MAIPNGRIRVNVTGARGALGIELPQPVKPGQFLLKAAGDNQRSYVGTSAATPANAVAATDLAGPTGGERVGIASQVANAPDFSLAELANSFLTAYAAGARPIPGFDNKNAFANIQAQALLQSNNSQTVMEVLFAPGIYEYSNSGNWAIRNLSLKFAPGVILKYTGSGNGFIVDGGENDQVHSVQISGKPVLVGNSSAKNGLYWRSVHQSDIDMIVRDFPNHSYHIEFAVSCSFDLRCSPIGQLPFDVTPVRGLYVGARASDNAPTSACVFYNTVQEGINGYGIELDFCIQSGFLRGTSENNVAGLFVSPRCVGNHFDGLDLEFNQEIDIYSTGVGNNYNGLISDKRCEFRGTREVILMGRYNEIFEGGISNVALDVTYAIAGGAFTSQGSDFTKQRAYNATSQKYDIDLAPRPVELHRIADQSYGTITGSAALLVANGRVGDIASVKFGDGNKLSYFNGGATLNVTEGPSIFGVFGKFSGQISLPSGAGVPEIIDLLKRFGFAAP